MTIAKIISTYQVAESLVHRWRKQLLENGIDVFTKDIKDKCAIYPDHKTTISHALHKKYPYLLRGLEVTRSNQVWQVHITYWRPKEALKWLDEMEIPINHSWQQDKKDLKIQALELDANYEQAQKERLLWFSETLSPKLYGEILKAAKPDFKEIFQSDAVKKAFQFPEPHVALSFLVQIQEFEEVAKFVHARYNEFNGRQFYTLRTAADLLQNTDPIAATLLYRKMIEPVLDETKSKYYNYAAKDLVTCGVLNYKIANWGVLQNHEEYIKILETKHKRKVSFWAEYESALQKQAAKEAKIARNSV